MNVEDLQSQTIRWMRFPLAVAIVYSHNFSSDIQQNMSTINWTRISGDDLYYIICVFISGVLARCARPCFFMFAGFLFFHKIKKWNRQAYFGKITRRLKTLAIPYLLWNIIAVVVTVSYFFIRYGNGMNYILQLWENGLLKIFWNYHTDGGWNNIFGYPVSVYYPYNATMWFIRDLIMLVLLSPLVYYFLKYAKLPGIFFLGACFYAFAQTYVNATFFFCIGAYFSVHGKNMIIELKKWKSLWFIIALITMILATRYRTSINILPVFIITGSISIIIIISELIEKGRINADRPLISFLAKTSFFIFATHTVFLLEWSRKLMGYICRYESTFFLIMKYLTTPILCVCICVGLYYVANKIAPKTMNILTGGR